MGKSESTTDSAVAAPVETAKVKGWYKPLIPMAMTVCLAGMCFLVVMYLGSVYVMDANLGDESLAGLLGSCNTIGSVVCSLIFGYVYARLKGATPIPAFVAFGVCYLLMAFAPSAAMAIVCNLIMGGFFGIYQSYFSTRCTDLVPNQYNGIAIGVVNFMYNIGSCLTTYFAMGIMGLQGSSNILSVWPVLGVIFLVLAVVSVFVFKYEKKIVPEA